MKIKKLNTRGFSHHFVMALVVVATAIGGVGYLVASHAQVPYQNSFSCPSQPELSKATASSNPVCTKYVQTVVGITADGSFGPNTKLAVQEFQFANKVAGSSCGSSVATCDGIVGPYTWAKLVAVNAAKVRAAQPAPAATVAPKPAPVSPAPAPAPAPKPAPAAPAPTASTTATSTADCIKIYGATFVYGATDKRCTSIIKPTCPTGTTLASTPAGNGTNTIYSCNGTPTPKPTTPVSSAPAPTVSPDCVKIYGSGFFYNADSKHCITIAQPTCPTGTVVKTIKPGSVVFYYCDGTPTIKPTAPVSPAPVSTAPAVATNSADCIRIYGSTFRYSADKRCTSIVRPTACPSGTVITTIPGNAVVSYYCAQTITPTSPATTVSQLIACTYFLGVNETKTTDSTHTKTSCDNLHKSQSTWKNCPVVVNGKTTTAIHSVAYCATHKPKTDKPVVTPKPATTSSKPISTPAPSKPVAINDPNLCKTHFSTIHPGDRGVCVAYLQSQLRIGVDGIYDIHGTTRDRVEAKQTKACLTTDGVVGPKTWKAINSPSYNECASASSSNTTFNCSYLNEKGQQKTASLPNNRFGHDTCQKEFKSIAYTLVNCRYRSYEDSLRGKIVTEKLTISRCVTLSQATITPIKTSTINRAVNIFVNPIKSAFNIPL